MKYRHVQYCALFPQKIEINGSTTSPVSTCQHAHVELMNLSLFEQFLEETGLFQLHLQLVNHFWRFLIVTRDKLLVALNENNKKENLFVDIV